MKSGDFDGDGMTDIAAFVGARLDLFTNTFDYKSKHMQYFSVTGIGALGTVTALAVADLDRNTLPDIIAGGDSVNIYLNYKDSKGVVTFTLANQLTATGPHFVDTGDFNGDGILDVVATSESTNAILVWLGTGPATFKPYKSTIAGNGPRHLAIADFNGDGHLDAATAKIGRAHV